MSVKNNGKPPRRAPSRPPQDAASKTSNAAAQAKATRPTAKTATADDAGQEQWPDAFETDPAMSRSFADGKDGMTQSGVRSSGIRQMAKVLLKTHKGVLDDIATLSSSGASILEEMVAGNFSDDVLGATSEKSKSRREKLNALRRREIKLRRRLRLLGTSGKMHDPSTKTDVDSLQNALQKAGNGGTPAKDQAMEILRSGGSPDGTLRIPVVDGGRTHQKATALASVLPQVSSAAFIAELLSDGPSTRKATTGDEAFGHDAVLACYRQRAACMESAA